MNAVYESRDEEYLDVARKINRVGRKMNVGRGRDLESVGLTSNQADAIGFFIRNPGSQISDLRDWLDISHQAACGLVDRMKAKGLLIVTTSDSDARARDIRVSPEGERLFVQIGILGTRAGERVMKGISEEDVHRLADLLDRMLENLAEPPDNN